jgi:RIO kinase 1
MRIPERLVALTDEGIIEQVVRPLMSGKEAQVYLVIAGGEPCVAKVYKEAQDRTFKQRALYTEGRAVRNSRDQRAMAKRTRHGREQDEAAWRAAEVDVIYRLRAAGVRVPKPHQFIDGVLIMELITDDKGQPAPRLGDVNLEREQASAVFDRLLSDVVRMLSVGVVHGDLSTFNVLLGSDGPVIIDFPQAVNASSNQNARQLLLRDIDNLQRFVRAFTLRQAALPYGQELWNLYERGELTADTSLTGRFAAPQRPVDTRAVQALILDAERDARQRQPQGQGSQGRNPNRRVEVIMQPPARRDRAGAPRQDRSGPGPRAPVVQPHQPRQDGPRGAESPSRRARPVQPQRGALSPAQPVANASGQPRAPDAATPQPQAAAQAQADPASTQRKRRRRRRRGKRGNPNAALAPAVNTTPPEVNTPATARPRSTTR